MESGYCLYMETTQPDPVAAAVRRVIDEHFGGSKRAAALEAGIAYATFHRRLKDGGGFTVAELNRIGKAASLPLSFFTGGTE